MLDDFSRYIIGINMRAEGVTNALDLARRLPAVTDQTIERRRLLHRKIAV